MTPSHPRPLSPHLTIWKWGPHMLVSIIHRVTGGALTTVGLAVLTWWLMALAGGEGAYAKFIGWVNWDLDLGVVKVPVMLVVLIGLLWAFWQHLLSGLRHLVLDTGAGYELKVNKFWSIMTIVGSAFLAFLSLYFILGIGR